MSYTTGVGPVDANSTVLFFTDSGPVAGSTDYTTVVIFHGSTFTGHTFHKLLPMAAENNLRLVIPNRRGYAGSTKYTDEELAEITAGKTEFLQRLGSESAYFLAWFIKTNNIPKIGADGKSGGLATIGWSFGITTPLAILSHPEAIPKETYDSLEPYFRQMIFYDPPNIAFGYDQPPEGYNPWIDPELKTVEEIFDNFGYWVSGYYDHPDLASRSLSGLDFSKRGARPSIKNMTPDDMKLTFDGEAAGKMEFHMCVFFVFPTIDSSVSAKSGISLLCNIPSGSRQRQHCTTTRRSRRSCQSWKLYISFVLRLTGIVCGDFLRTNAWLPSDLSALLRSKEQTILYVGLVRYSFLD
ncbi:hypothetical protein EDD18DRAFT_1065220 [Armillaria luteobubalina]|uniref:AB hydrolase-1 domain-containing protein n=1 Tax=Armillaria luteobubalina TaxID=153913 RepID=A0AA39QFW3_9AGAR|nr:hypothetical protein EDD18DRAFT_1065220 [Armillaria luteobubalina]